MREAGKGDKQRPTDHKAFADGYDRIFRKPIDDSEFKGESIWSEQYVRDNPKLAAQAIATLQTLLEDRDQVIKEHIIGEK